MEVQDNPDQDGGVTEEEIASTVAKAGHSYPIRILHLVNRTIVIGFVISVFPETTMVLRPYTVSVNFNPETENIEEYEFTPYLDQLAHYDPTDLQAIPFMNSAIISIVRPSQHVVENYNGLIQIKETVAVTPAEEDIEILMHREYPSKHTLH